MMVTGDVDGDAVLRQGASVVGWCVDTQLSAIH